MFFARSGRLRRTLRDRLLSSKHARERQRDSHEFHPHLFLLFCEPNWLAMTDAEENISRQQARYRASFGRMAIHILWKMDRSE
jgi:hypothetical protein